MPVSIYHHVYLVSHLVSQLRPESVLDVGVGFGKWGHLFREMTDIAASSDDFTRYCRSGWKCKIDGIEGFEPYLTDMHRFLYDQIHVGNMLEVIKTLGNYDVIFMGDVIEHVEKDQGLQFLRDALDHANKAVILSTPAFEMPQHCATNALEDHRSVWTARDFKTFDRAYVTTAHSKILVAMLLKAGVDAPAMPRPFKSFVRTKLIQLLGAERYEKLIGI